MATRKKSRSTRSTTDGVKKRPGEDETRAPQKKQLDRCSERHRVNRVRVRP